MKHTPIDNSSNIKAIGYDEKNNTLEVIFKNGGHYSYENVSIEMHKELMTADSVGTHFSKHIKGKHKFNKVK